MPQIGDRLPAGIAHFCLVSGLGRGSDLAQHRIVVVRKFAGDSLEDLEILLRISASMSAVVTGWGGISTD
ncbi:hypothetical protein [Mesorhizobium sp. CA4]|uniref:hypothetical protein n=1 Tax=Mesorhizobium sp. CA4 TaxID=588499 RepID=UPI001CD0C6FD|nr:hypothetical protein [Mesorhizobium sp. CA4]MBZ9821306.1 hypothetical protein [Mesorhizobium sp. CA4]